MEISILIPTYNRKQLLANTLLQLENQISRINNIRFYIVIVIDGSSDGTLEFLNEKYPNYKKVLGDGNWWYTKSMNEGFRYIVKRLKSDFVITLNDDIDFHEKFLVKLTEPFCSNRNLNNEIHAAVSVIPGRTKRIYYGGTVKETWYGRVIYRIPTFSLINESIYKGLYSTTRITGRGLIIPINLLKELNYFDDFFTQYKSDTDFGLRALSAGYKLKVNFESILFVNLNETSSDASYIKQNHISFLKSFFKPQSRNYLPSVFIFNVRHKGVLLGFLAFIVDSFIKIKKQFLN